MSTSLLMATTTTTTRNNTTALIICAKYQMGGQLLELGKDDKCGVVLVVEVVVVINKDVDKPRLHCCCRCHSGLLQCLCCRRYRRQCCWGRPSIWRSLWIFLVNFCFVLVRHIGEVPHVMSLLDASVTLAVVQLAFPRLHECHTVLVLCCCRAVLILLFRAGWLRSLEDEDGGFKGLQV